jgi:alcohol dehydrogenase class IV
MSASEIREFFSPTHVIFGWGASGRTGAEARRLGGKRVLVVTDQRVHGAGLTRVPLDALKATGLETVIYADCKVDPDIAMVEEVFGLYRARDCDVVVVIGGGSPICLGRAVALRASNPDMSLVAMEGMNVFKHPPKPTVLVTTTTGSGSEVSPVFIITDPDRMVKMNIGGRGAQATVSILDPAMLKSLNADIVLATGMDAITHTIEAFTSNRSSLMTDALALRAFKTLWQHIGLAALEGNEESRAQMLYAGITAVLAAGNARLGLVHAMSDQPCAFYHIPHGIANALMIPAVMEYNLPAARDKFVELAQAAGERVDDLADPPRAFLRAIDRLYKRLRLPTRLPDEIDTARFDDWADRTMENPLFVTTVRKPSKPEIIELYHRAKADWSYR